MLQSLADKACIDQSKDIAVGIRALPIFLAGSRQMLVLAGKTWASRLWCVMEVFAFLKIGRSRDELRVRQLAGTDLTVELSRFDAARAKCFLATDRDRMLGVVESAFGELRPFNKLVRGLLTDSSQQTLSELAAPSETGNVRKTKGKGKRAVRV